MINDYLNSEGYVLTPSEVAKREKIFWLASTKEEERGKMVRLGVSISKIDKCDLPYVLENFQVCPWL